MKLSNTLLFLALPFVAMAAPESKLGGGNGRGLRGNTDEEVDIVGSLNSSDSGEPLRDFEIDQLFMDDINSGDIGDFMVHPDGDEDEDEDGEGRKLQSTTHVLLCKHSNCQGGHVWVPPGRYPSMPWQIGNDQLTQVYIPARFTFTYYEHTWYGGWQRTFGEPNRRVSLHMGGHNDAVSSFIIRKF